MRLRRRGRPKGTRVAGRIIKILGAVGGVQLAVACLVVSGCLIGAKAADTASRQTPCQPTGATGRSGLEVVGDSTLLGLADRLPRTRAGGPVLVDVSRGRTAQQGVNLLAALPDSAPATVVVSLAADDTSSTGVYTQRIDDLALLLAGRTVYWITAPGHDTDTRIVRRETAAAGSGWTLLDFAGAVRRHPGWWRTGHPTSGGLTYLATALLRDLTAHPTPTGEPPAVTVTSSTDPGDAFPLTGDRLANARTIITVGTRMRVPRRGLVIAVAVAVQESTLLNLPGGPAGAHGIFQQTPPAWGTLAQVQDPVHAATAFYTTLLQVPGWQRLALTDAGQAVQRSAYPHAYAQWERSATVIVAALTGAAAAGCGPATGGQPDPRAQIAVQAALSQLGVPYAFAGGDLSGPTLGVCQPGTDGWNDCHITGFDCSGLLLYAWGQAGVTVPHYTGAMWTDPTFTHITDQSQLQPGDMMMFDGTPPDHTGLYLGRGQLIDATHSGSVVTIESIHDPWYADLYVGALRPPAGPNP